MKVESTPLPGLLILEPVRHGDARGFFSESYHKARLAEHGISTEFVQDNHSLSAEQHTVRGLHYQRPPHAQAKLVRCGRGTIFDVAVDFRRGSPTYGQWFGVELSFENGRQLFVPEGFLHGFSTLQPNCEIVYKCSDYYAPDCDAGIRFDDPDLGIDWQIGDGTPILSDKDRNAEAFAAVTSPFTFDDAP